jgi:hypothetical protein
MDAGLDAIGVVRRTAAGGSDGKSSLSALVQQLIAGRVSGRAGDPSISPQGKLPTVA